MERGTFPPQKSLRGGGPHRLRPGEWTDDTAMALRLGEHLLKDPHLRKPCILAKMWIDWWRRGEGSCTGHCFDIGIQTSSALRDWEAGVAPSRGGDGNGGLMRVAPIALRHWLGAEREIARLAAEQSRVTHVSVLSDHCCGKYSLLLARIMSGTMTVEEVRECVLSKYEMARADRNDIKSSGYVVHTFEAAMWCIANTRSAGEAIRAAVDLGDDADTTGAVVGALAGALYGVGGLPTDWLKLVAWRPRIEKLALRLGEECIKEYPAVEGAAA